MKWNKKLLKLLDTFLRLTYINYILYNYGWKIPGIFKKFLDRRKFKKEIRLQLRKIAEDKTIDPMVYSLRVSELMRKLKGKGCTY